MGRVIPFVLPEQDGFMRTSLAVLAGAVVVLLSWGLVIGALAGAWLALDSLLSLFRG